ncbi:MAG: molybdenum cofactor biosynthesis protein A [Candidatus Methanofastidiosum methylothiophilum]|uniref:Molybdenum cofactor biosynthesis protein A n=1 Tax=Candidatus Methanofastidiosum methylothiophilum TaxID=1705564 RepID=A0A150IIU2_9EURY|nr:MAG: molybdenum cofactor biosynthesis protein A [Candidatus Methanofastidiosum methylthiophilus]KYC47006.1 MAG: molybdenum cofactor biosynthesis protein A [Candidatus Methanofastidiosum methylthiophilus]KYC49377.1 MAG: molybdenum cofactor biosynthesis protein A [Candidatus Methanofastidiosum methylthiophilus]
MIKNILLGRPFLIVFNITRRCNSLCTMCSIWEIPSKIKDELTLEEIEVIFKDLKSYGAKHVFLQGGEPLLRKDILQIIELLIVLGFNPTLITNGLLLNENNINKLSDLKCNVSISLDTLDRERYKKIRGVDKLPLLLNIIEQCSKIKNKKGMWHINATISKVNYDEALDIFNFARKNGFKFNAYPYNYAHCHSSAHDEELSYEEDRDKIIETFNKLRLAAQKEGMIFDKIIYDDAIKYLEGKYNMPCDAMKRSILITENGKISPCLEFKPKCNIKEIGIHQAFKEMDYSKIKKCYTETPCFYGCTRGSGIVIRKIPEIFFFTLRHPKIIASYIKAYFF